jgi:hypothetical protein
MVPRRREARALLAPVLDPVEGVQRLLHGVDSGIDSDYALHIREGSTLEIKNRRADTVKCPPVLAVGHTFGGFSHSMRGRNL